MLRKLLLAATASLLAATSTFAQYGIPRGPKCLEVGYTYGIAYGEFKYSLHSFNESTGIASDTSYTNNVTSKLGFGGFVGYYFPVAKLGPQNRLAITLSYMYNAYLWEGEAFAVSSSSRYGTTSIGSGTVEMALPVGADYKIGCDALFDKTKRSCFSFGTGVYPSFGVTVFQGNGGFQFHARPFLKAEAGFFAGICFKARVIYIPGGMDYFNIEDNRSGYYESSVFKSKGTLNLSLVIMPMSWKWGRSEWWGK